MDTHSSDTPINRFFSYWGAIFTVLAFGIITLLFVGFQKGCMAGRAQEIGAIDDERRLEIGKTARMAQDDAVSTWAKNEDGTLRVPPMEAISRMSGTFAKPEASSVPVPGTPAEEAAAMAMVGNAAPVEEETQGDGDTESN